MQYLKQMKEKKLICFDVDGVLVSSDEVHFLSLKETLEINTGFILEKSTHDKIASLSTEQKIDWLVSSGLLTPDRVDITKIKKDKFYLIDKYSGHFLYNYEVANAAISAKENFNFALVSNARTEYVKKIADELKILGIVYCVGNDLGLKPKPAPDMYLRAMSYYNTLPSNTMIFEDSDVGLEAAYASRAVVQKVTFSEFNKDLFVNSVKTL